MNQNQINIKLGKGFPWHFKLLAVVFIAISFIIISDQPIVSAILSFIAIAIFTANSGVELDLEKKTYKEYQSFFYLIRIGTPTSFKEIEYLFIKAEQVSQKVYTFHTMNSSTFQNQEYASFIRFGEFDKIRLWSQKDKKSLLQKLSMLGQQLNTDVIDYTKEESKTY